MTVADVEQKKADWKLILEWRRCDRYILGYGIVPGKYSEAGDLEKGYDSFLIGLKSWETVSLKEQRSRWGRLFGFFSDLEFEVQSRSLLGHFPPETLRGMSPIEYRELFLRYAHKHPETVQGGKERQQCIDRMTALKLIRKEWYDHTCEKQF